MRERNVDVPGQPSSSTRPVLIRTCSVNIASPVHRLPSIPQVGRPILNAQNVQPGMCSVGQIKIANRARSDYRNHLCRKLERHVSMMIPEMSPRRTEQRFSTCGLPARNLSFRPVVRGVWTMRQCIVEKDVIPDAGLIQRGNIVEVYSSAKADESSFSRARTSQQQLLACFGAICGFFFAGVHGGLCSHRISLGAPFVATNATNLCFAGKCGGPHRGHS
jgi:hypothetical protein